MNNNFQRKLICVTALVAVLLCSSQALAQTNAPSVYRNATYYDISRIGGPLAILVISTYPVQAYQPVYSWRQHRNGTGSGTLGYNGDLIGYTDGNGRFQIVANVPNEGVYCGLYTNERFAVGSRYYPRSQPISFTIDRAIDFGPPDPRCSFFN